MFLFQPYFGAKLSIFFNTHIYFKFFLHLVITLQQTFYHHEYIYQ